MTVVINELETVGEAHGAAAANAGASPEVAQRAERRRARMAASRYARMARN